MDNTNFTTTGTTHHKVHYSQSVWKGRNKYITYFNLYIGTEWYKGCLLVIATIINYFVYVIHIIPPLTNANSFTNVIVVFIYTIIFIITLILCLLCVTGDPGVLPMNDFHNKAILFGKNTMNDIQHDSTVNHTNSNLKSKRVNKQYVLNGRKYKMKFCNTCLIYRPLRCSHCKICNACIERYDHHCPWVGNCIGRNNYVYFYFYVLSFSLFTCVSLIITIVFSNKCMKCIKNSTLSYCENYLMDSKYNYNEGKMEISFTVYVKETIAFVFIVIHFFSFCFLVILFGFHTRYLFTNETTAFRAKYENENFVFGNPFNKGFINNIKIILFKKYFKRKSFNEEHTTKSIEHHSMTDYENPKVKKVFMDAKKLQGDSSQTFFIKNKDIINFINNTNNTNQRVIPTTNKNQFNSKQSSLMNTQISQREQHVYGNAHINKKRTVSNKGLISSMSVANYPELEDIGSEKEKAIRSKLNFERSHNDCFNWNNYSNICEYDNNSSVTSARDKSTNLISNVFLARGNYVSNSRRDNNPLTQSNVLIESGMQSKNLNSIP